MSHGRYNALKEADAALSKMKSVSSLTRVWSTELPPYMKDGKEKKGSRFFWIATPEEAYLHIISHNADIRFQYELIRGPCHMYADYDLPLSELYNVESAHAEFNRVMSLVLLEKVSVIKENVLVAHIPGKKESMHVRWELLDEDGFTLMFESPEDCRRVVSAALRLSLSEHPFEKNPLFYPGASPGLFHCILDWLVYNTNRNFRLAGCLKARVRGSHTLGRLVDSHTPTITPTKAVFMDNLVCLDSKKTKFIDVSDLPDDLDAIRYESGSVSTAPPRFSTSGGLKTVHKRPHAVAPSVSSSFSYSLKPLEKWILQQLHRINPADNLSVSCRGEGTWFIRTSSLYCPMKEAVHKDSDNGCFIIHLSYPLPTGVHRCFKTKCMDKSLFRKWPAIELKPTESEMAEYKKLCEALLKEISLKGGDPFTLL